MSLGTMADMPGRTSARQPGPGQSGAAALVTIAEYHGLRATYGELRALLRGGSLRLDTLSLLFLASELGFDAVALEGEADDLPQVPRPNIVLFRGHGDEPEYRVLYDIDSTSAVLSDPATGGVTQLSRGELARRFRGDAIQVLPDPAELPRRREALEARRRLSARLLSALGARPRSAVRALTVALGVMVAVVVVLRLCGRPGLASASVAPFGLCLLFALVSWTHGRACAACMRASSLAGRLPLAPLGAAYYAAAFGLAALYPSGPVLGPVAAFAAGAHLSFLGVLWRARAPCALCLATALSAFAALALLLPASPVAGVALAGAGGLAAAILAVALEHRLEARRARADGAALAAALAAEPLAMPPEVRVVAYKRQGCPACHFYEKVLRPTLQEELGPALRFEERDAAAMRIAAPFFLVIGRSRLLVGHLSPDEAHDALRSAVRRAAG
jgi:hypothetical protein